MGELTDMTKQLQDRARLAMKNIPDWQRKMPGVADTIDILSRTLDLLGHMAIQVEYIEQRTTEIDAHG